MRTKEQTQKTHSVDTWLPVFSGFYGTIWETDNDEEMEIENINEKRRENGILQVITWDDIEWDFKGYQNQVVEGMTNAIGHELQRLGMIEGFKFQKLVSPREYNFRNDSIDVSFEISRRNVIKIGAYLEKNLEAFKEYLKEKYTDGPGFFSSYQPDVTHWTGDALGETLGHGHKLGSVLEFVLENEDKDLEETIHEKLSCNGVTLQALNYSKLTEEI